LLRQQVADRRGEVPGVTAGLVQAAHAEQPLPCGQGDLAGLRRGLEDQQPRVARVPHTRALIAGTRHCCRRPSHHFGSATDTENGKFGSSRLRAVTVYSQSPTWALGISMVKGFASSCRATLPSGPLTSSRSLTGSLGLKARANISGPAFVLRYVLVTEGSL